MQRGLCASAAAWPVRRVAVERLEGRRLLASTPFISEFVANNSAGLRDADGDRPDWIEIHNPTTAAVSLGGHYLTDDAANKKKWAFPALTLPAKGYLVVFASDKNRRVAGQPLHTNFKLDAGGEYLALVKPDGTTVLHQFSPKFPEQLENVSYGTASDGRVGYFTAPTPGAANGNLSILGVVADTKFDRDRGFYDAPFSVTVTTATAGAQIRYTTDGSAPTANSGTVYTGPVRVTTTTVLRAAAFKTGFTPSNVDTQTYLFLKDVIRQPVAPAGWPAPGTLGVRDNYEMDPDVVNAPAYKDRIIPALKSIPTLSLAMKRSDLFGATGIYTNSVEEGEEWERPGSAELILPDGSTGFQVDAGVRIQGGVGRRPVFPKHSFRLLFKDKYGNSKLKYPLFKNSPGGATAEDEFDTITLRAGFNKTWAFADETERRQAQYLHDQFMAGTQLAMGQPAIHGTFVHLYIDGVYWGLYNAVERPDANFAASYFGGTRSQYDALNSGNAVDGDRAAWEAMHAIANGVAAGTTWSAANPNPAALATSAAYERIKQYLDVENFADYMMANFYGGNQDWDSHNWYAARKRDSTGRFRFFSWDAERTLESTGTNRTGLNLEDKPSRLYTQLRANAEFRVLFADRVHKHLFNDGALTPSKVRERYLQLGAMIDGAIIAESARWGDFRRPDLPYTRDAEWVAEQNRLLNSYFPARTTTVLNQFKAIGLYPSVNAPMFAKHGGSVASGYQLTMTRPGGQAGTLYYTLDGSDPRLPGGGVSPSARVYGGPVTLTSNVTVKARIVSGGTWSALNGAPFAVTGATGSIAGTVFNDLDGDGSRDAGEPALGAWRVFIDADNDGVLDSGERSVLSDAAGNYRFTGLAAGSYRVRQVLQGGWRVVKPTSGSHAVTLAAGQAATGRHFGDTRNVLIAGSIFNDADGDGVRDSGESGISAWRVFIDADNDGVLDAGERSVLTDSAGAYKFTDCAAGAFVVRAVPASGWSITSPASRSYSFTLTAAQSTSGRNFGARQG